jgi:hypothetical protein
MDITQSQTIKILEELVHKRFNKETLEAYLTEKFSYPITLDDVSRIKYPDGFHLFADIDIYFLKMRRAGWDDSDIYITEVSYEFE